VSDLGPQEGLETTQSKLVLTLSGKGYGEEPAGTGPVLLTPDQLDHPEGPVSAKTSLTVGTIASAIVLLGAALEAAALVVFGLSTAVAASLLLAIKADDPSRTMRSVISDD
jgi:hypothetical protein